MKILQTIAGFGAHSGGTSTCTYDLLSAMHDMGCDVDLMTVKVKDPTDKLMGHDEEWIKALDNDCRTPYGWSPNMTRFLRASDYDIYHTNGMWMHCNHETCTKKKKKTSPTSLRRTGCSTHRLWHVRHGRRSCYSTLAEWRKTYAMQLAYTPLATWR